MGLAINRKRAYSAIPFLDYNTPVRAGKAEGPAPLSSSLQPQINAAVPVRLLLCSEPEPVL